MKGERERERERATHTHTHTHTDTHMHIHTHTTSFVKRMMNEWRDRQTDFGADRKFEILSLSWNIGSIYTLYHIPEGYREYQDNKLDRSKKQSKKVIPQ